MSYDYQWEMLKEKSPVNSVSDFKPRFGPVVLDRDEQGRAKKVRFQLLADNFDLDVFLVAIVNSISILIFIFDY